MLDKIKNSEEDGKQQIITGIWKFKQEIPLSELQEVAKGWLKDEKYMSLYIRQVSKDQHGVGFMYDDRASEDNEKSYDEFFDQSSDMLKKKFGNGLCGWDLSSSTILIK